MKTLLIILLTCLTLPVLASEETTDCDNALTTLEINQCAANELESARLEMQRYLAK